MRKTDRIEPFMMEIAKIWKEKCPDWRFGQLIVNVLGSQKRDPFFPEEEEMLKIFKDYFHIEEETDAKCN